MSDLINKTLFWKPMTQKEIVQKVNEALNGNKNYTEFSDNLMGFPGSFLDDKIFPKLDDLFHILSPKVKKKMEEKYVYTKTFIEVLKKNPNHIGCHTLEKSTSEFQGTHQIEEDLLRICAEVILGAEKNTWDGFVASGGTEANIQAMWIFRNIWLDKNSGTQNHFHSGQLHVIASEDSHYSMEKGVNLLGMSCYRVKIDETNNREINLEELLKEIKERQSVGILKFLIVLNMGSTNFGSVDDIDRVTKLLDDNNVNYEIHVDAAFGGFIYTFTNPDNKLIFTHPKIMSFTLDAHKMLQMPYGTGIFLTKKNRIEKVTTASATYIPGKDVTICGSRSGANTIAIWMMLQAYGSEEGEKFCKGLIELTDYLCLELDKLHVNHYRNKFMNVVAIDSKNFPKEIAEKYHLQADDHEDETKQKWWRLVVMEHVNKKMINRFLKQIRKY